MMRRSRAPLIAALGLGLGWACATTPECPESSPPVATAEVVPAGETEPPPASEPFAGEPSIVIFVRHAEKAADGSADPPLTERGERRAQCLARMLAPLDLDRLLATEYQRTQATLAPLSEVAQRQPQIIEAADASTWAKVLGQLPPASRVVVAGHSNTIPAWVRSLGTELPGLDAEGNIPHDDYDRFITVVLDERGHALATTTMAYCTEP